MLEPEALTIENCTLAFQCPKTWGALEATPDANVRHCHACAQKVFLVQTDEELRHHVAQRHCIAFIRVGLPYVGTTGSGYAASESPDRIDSPSSE